jgi:hypothetical protein
MVAGDLFVLEVCDVVGCTAVAYLPAGAAFPAVAGAPRLLEFLLLLLLTLM